MDGRIEVQRLVGFGDRQVVVTKNIFFWRNGKTVPAAEVTAIRKTVLIDTCKVLFDKVLLIGRLRKDVMFRELDECTGQMVGSGDIMVDVPFATEIDVRGARPDDTCVVVKAFVEGEVEEPLCRTKAGGFKGMIDTSVLFLCVKVLREAFLGDCDDWDGSDPSKSGGCGESEHSTCKGKEEQSKGKEERSAKHRCESDHSGDKSHSGSCPEDPWADESGRVHAYTVSTGGHSDHHAKKRDRRCRECPDRQTTGLVVGHGGRVPNAKPGRVIGSFIGPTILFPGLTLLGHW